MESSAYHTERRDVKTKTEKQNIRQLKEGIRWQTQRGKRREREQALANKDVTVLNREGIAWACC